MSDQDVKIDACFALVMAALDGRYPRPRCQRCGREVERLDLEPVDEPKEPFALLLLLGCHGEQEARQLTLEAACAGARQVVSPAFGPVPPAELVTARPAPGARMDGFCRLRWVVAWIDPTGSFRPELAEDAAPVGHRREQTMLLPLGRALRLGGEGRITRVVWPMRGRGRRPEPLTLRAG